MKNQRPSSFPCQASGRLLAGFLLFCAFGAHATAPRINAQMFGEEKHAEIIGYQTATTDAAVKKESELAAEILAEAFRIAGATPTVDELPSRQLAAYELINNDAVGFIGSPADLEANPKIKYHSTVFAFRDHQPIALILHTGKRGDELHKAFVQGLRQLVKTGKYLELAEKYLGKGQLSSDYVTRLKQQNPGRK